MDRGGKEGDDGCSYRHLPYFESWIGHHESPLINEYDAYYSGSLPILHSKGKSEGTGIGLAVTKRVIDKHNGW